MPFGIGVQELIWVLIIVLVLFGGRKIPEVMRGLGQGLQEFRKASSQVHEEINKAALPEPSQDANQGQKPA